MADDTRQPPSSIDGDQPLRPDKAFGGEQWNDATPSYKPPENANLMAGGTQNTAGGQVVDVRLTDAAKSIKMEDWTKFPRKPCVKDSLMTGIVSGAAVGAGRAIWRAPLMVACNWAVGTFCFGAFSMYQYCNYQRQAEKEGMKRAMEIIDRKTLERRQKEARMERIREVRRQKKEEEDAETFARLKEEKEKKEDTKSWWKVW